MTASRKLGVNPMSFGSMFWENQFKTEIALPPQGNSLDGSVVIITGANSGLGFECAKQMLQAGVAHLIMGVRSLKKGQAAAHRLRAVGSKAVIDVWDIDMENYSSIRGFVDRCESALQRIDFVILNAGLAAASFTKSQTGHELDIQVNYLSTVLLTVLMLPVLNAKGPLPTGRAPRLTAVSSATARNVKFLNRDKRPLLPSFDDTTITPWDAADRYGVSKLLGQLTIERIAERYINPSKVVLTLVEPGWVRSTGLNQGLPWAIRGLVHGILRVAGRSIDQGAATYFDAVVLQDEHSHGSYIMNCKPAP